MLLQSMANRKGLLNFTLICGILKDVKEIPIPVAAAASVPFSATLIRVLCTTCEGSRALPTSGRGRRREAACLQASAGTNTEDPLLTCHHAGHLVQCVCPSQQPCQLVLHRSAVQVCKLRLVVVSDMPQPG